MVTRVWHAQAPDAGAVHVARKTTSYAFGDHPSQTRPAELSKRNPTALQGAPRRFGDAQGLGCIAMHADRVDARWNMFAIFGDDGSGLYHINHTVGGMICVVDHRAGLASVNQCGVIIVAAIGKYLAGHFAAQIFDR